MEQLEQITRQLKTELERLKTMYEQNDPPQSLKDKQFFSKMKHETAPVYDLLIKWESVTLEVLQQHKLNLHPRQVASTRENMELLLMHSYYIDTRQKNYMELYKSIMYVFDQLLRNITVR